MTNQHPLTDEICEEIAEDVFYYDYSIPILRCDMRFAADWQLEQVNDFFDNYRKTVMEVNPGHIPSLTELLSLMNQAMRPTTTTTQEDS
jgi:hypothetical protein